jgi:hypothetical protein
MRPVTLLFVVFALATLIACNDDTITPQGNTPADVLEILEESFNRRAVSVLDGVLNDDFIFYFDVNDVGHEVGGYIIPASWGRDDHMAACGNMLEQVYSIDFIVNTTDIEDPEGGATVFEANHVPARLLIMVDANNGYLAQGFFDFELVYDDSAGYDDWKVSDWYDDTCPGLSGGLSSTGVEHSFGTILAMFR